MLAPSGCGYEQDCSRCHDPELRKRWGCDEATEEPQALIEPCPVCAGKNPSCEHCAGSNRMPVHRCPNALVDDNCRATLRAALMAEQSGVLPDSGGWQDQAATFVQAFPVAQQEIRHWQEVARRKASGK